MTLTIIFGKTGQTLSHVPPAKATSPTYKIENLDVGLDDDDRVIAEGDATNPSWSISSSAAAGADQRNAAKISTASTDGATIGAACSFVGPDGSRETARIRKISTNSYVEVDTDLAGIYPIGSTLYGIEFTAPFPDADAADEDLIGAHLRIVWNYSVDGVKYNIPAPIQFVRHTSSVDVSVGEAIVELRTLYPDMPGRLAEGGEFDKIVERIAVKVANDLRRNEIGPETYMMGPQGLELIVARMLVLAAEHGYAPGKTTADRRWYEQKKAEYDAMLATMVSDEPGAGVVLTDAETDTSISIPEDPPRWAQTVNTPVLREIDGLWDL